MQSNDPVDLMPEEPSGPWWIDDIEDYLELLHGDDESLCEQHGHPHKNKVHNNYQVVNPRTCPKCSTVFHFTKRGGNDSCPFCRSHLNFIIV